MQSLEKSFKSNPETPQLQVDRPLDFLGGRLAGFGITQIWANSISGSYAVARIRFGSYGMANVR
jgi:hypothetical protein